MTSVFKIEGYEAQVQVLSDGTINLPRLGTVDVWGLTLDEARQRITDGYSQFLRKPLVYVDLVEQRPVRVTVTGQVLRPGVFTLPVNSQGSIGTSGDATGVGADGGGWPTMVDVIQKAGGMSATGVDPSGAAARVLQSRWTYQELRLRLPECAEERRFRSQSVDL